MINQLIKTPVKFVARLIALIVMVWCVVPALNEASAQPVKEITLEQCHNLTRQNYPLIKQQELIANSRDYSVSNAAKGYLPQLSINGQATYQSAVTELPIKLPNISVPQLSHDQYKLYGEVTQTLYDGGAIKQQKKLHETAAAVEDQKIEVELYRLKDRINQLYFGILLLQQQKQQTEVMIRDLDAALQKAEAAYANGVQLKSNVDVLKAERLRLRQRKTELLSNTLAYCDMLGYFTRLAIDSSTRLVVPQAAPVPVNVNRPELNLYEKQLQNTGLQNQLLNSRNRPKLGLFIQGGYGRPALNFLSNSFDAYYIGGVRLNWNIAGLYSFKNEKQLIALSSKSIDVQKNTFLFNTEISMKQQNAEIVKLNELLSTDDEIISLRSGIKRSYAAQLENGIINTSDYVKELNAEDLARQNKILHQIQLLMAQYNLLNTTGN